MGQNSLLINPLAEHLSGLFDRNSQHGELEREVILKSYDYCQCNSVNDRISVTQVLDLVGEIAYKKQLHNQDDLMDIKLLEEIGFHLQNLFGEQVQFPEARISNQSNQSKARVVSLEKAKILFANRLGS